ncbi:MAG: hypothetical protein WAR78_14225 [Ferruginibacter sp.]
MTLTTDHQLHPGEGTKRIGKDLKCTCFKHCKISSFETNWHQLMKMLINIFILLLTLCGLSNTCKADTVDNYQIYIGNTRKLTEASFRPAVSQITFLTLDSSNYSDTIHINFNHCTAGASSRQIKLTDTAGNTIKVWDFGDKEQKPFMSIPIAEILTIPVIASKGSYTLYYHDREYLYWQLLTPVVIAETVAKKAAVNIPFIDSGSTCLSYGIGALLVVIVVYYFAGLKNKQRRNHSSNPVV